MAHAVVFWGHADRMRVLCRSITLWIAPFAIREASVIFKIRSDPLAHQSAIHAHLNCLTEQAHKSTQMALCPYDSGCQMQGYLVSYIQAEVLALSAVHALWERQRQIHRAEALCA